MCQFNILPKQEYHHDFHWTVQLGPNSPYFISNNEHCYERAQTGIPKQAKLTGDGYCC
jgi:hypothetical protein